MNPSESSEHLSATPRQQSSELLEKSKEEIPVIVTDKLTTSNKQKRESLISASHESEEESSGILETSNSFPSIDSIPDEGGKKKKRRNLVSGDNSPTLSVDSSAKKERLMKRKSTNKLDKRLSKVLTTTLKNTKKYGSIFFHDFENICQEFESTQDSLKDILVFPANDFSVVRELKANIQALTKDEIAAFQKQTGWLQECLSIYQQKEWLVVRFNYAEHGTPKISLPQVRQDMPLLSVVGSKRHLNKTTTEASTDDEGKKSNKSRRRKGHSAHQVDVTNILVEPITEERLAKDLETRKAAYKYMFFHYNTRVKVLGTQEMTDFSRSIVQNPFEFIGYPRKIQLCVQFREFQLPDMNEPFFLSAAIHDVQTREKISEDFDFELNVAEVRKMMDRDEKSMDPETLCNTCIFSYTGEPKSSIYLVVRMMKIFSEEEKEKALFGLLSKKKETKETSEIEKSAYTIKQPYCWTSIPLFPEGTVNTMWPTMVHVFTLMKSSYAYDEIYDSLTNEKKFKTINGQLSVTIQRLDLDAHPDTANRSIDPSYKRGPEFDESALKLDKYKRLKMVKILQEFGNQNLDFYLNHVNNLYIHPRSFFYKNTRAYIQIEMRLKDNDRSPLDKGLKSIYGKSLCKKFQSKGSTTISYLEKTPEFCDEVKILLPTVITPQHHFLFTFYEVDAKKGKRSVIGYSILPLLGSDAQLGFQEDVMSLPVCQDLPPDYMSPLSQAKIKWTDMKKGCFELSTKLISSIYTTDPKLSKLFFSYRKNIKKSDLSYGQLMDAIVQIHECNSITVFKYFPLIFNLLISLTCSQDEVIAKEAFISLLTLTQTVNTLSMSKYSFYLRAYVSCLFENALVVQKEDVVGMPFTTSTNAIYPFESLTKSYLRAIQMNNTQALQFDQHWFIFGLISKSMALYIHDENLLNSPRKNRFNDEFLASLQKLMSSLLSNVSLGVENVMSCALFLKDLFSLVDRGVLFTIISDYLSYTRGKHASTIVETHKFMFLKILTNYEHFVPLNLPRKLKPSQFQNQELTSFIQATLNRHFLVGQLIQEAERHYIQSIDMNSLRNQAIIVLRNILMRHEFDKRIMDSKRQRTVVSMYFPYIYFVVNDSNVINSMQKTEKEEWLICFMYILRCCPKELISVWWGRESQKKQSNFFTILEHCVATFRQAYLGKQTFFLVLDQIVEIVHKHSEELNMFTNDKSAGSNDVAHPALKKIVQIFQSLFERASDDIDLISYLYTPMQLFLETCSTGLINNPRSDLLGILVLEFVVLCNASSNLSRQFGASMLYILMKKAYEVSGSFQKMHTELGVSISRLVGTTGGSKQQYNGLLQGVDTIKKYTLEHDESTYVLKVEETLNHLVTLLDYSTKIENITDPEMIQDVYCQIEHGYQSNPELRVTWLDNLASHHTINEDYEEAAQCKMHVASLISQYLMDEGLQPTARKMRAKLPMDFMHFPLIAPNLVNTLPLGIHVGEIDNWHLKLLLGYLKQAAQLFDKATRYELSLECYHQCALLHKMERKYGDMISSMKDHVDLCERLSDRDNPPDRVYPVYFKVGFFGTKWEDLDGKQFIYKKTGKYNLSIFKKQLESQYENQFAPGELVIMSTNETLDRSQLDDAKSYIQMTGVQPYFDAEEADDRVAKCDVHFKIRQFLFETPFTKDGGSYSDDMAKQMKKKSIFQTKDYFPYLKSRLLIVSIHEIILSPIENAIENIETQITKLRVELESFPTRPKPLQQVIQGSVVPMVNQGPLKICEIFLGPGVAKQQRFEKCWLVKLVGRMQHFVKLCGFAIKLNKSFVDDQQRGFQEMVEKHYDDLERIVKNSTSQVLKEIEEMGG